MPIAARKSSKSAASTGKRPQKTVVQVSLAAQAAQPDSAASARIRQRLMVEWQKNHQPEPSAFKRISVFWSSSRLVLFASVVVVLLVGIFLSIPASGDSNSLAGAAQGSITGWPFLGIISIVVIVITIVFWINRRH